MALSFHHFYRFLSLFFIHTNFFFFFGFVFDDFRSNCFVPEIVRNGLTFLMFDGHSVY